MNGVWTIPKSASTQLPGDEQMGGTSEFSLCHPDRQPPSRPLSPLPPGTTLGFSQAPSQPGGGMCPHPGQRATGDRSLKVLASGPS